ncbi:hypothetical protein WNY78_13170 [Psychroserpens sp. AS72]|uniref:hypothetical protein n=1 Tax=Psychroserpens sp. AS72 TaxID=3135775 RepID=UPI00317BAF1C
MMTRCEDPLPAGIETTVSGNIVDEYMDIPLEGIKLRLRENLQNMPSRYIDSTLTDIDGYYTLNFTTSGEGVRYYIETVPSDSALILSNTIKEIDHIGQFNTIDFNGIKLYPFTFNITGENLIDGSITFSNVSFDNDDIEPLFGSNFVYTRYLRANPLWTFSMVFKRTLEDGTNQEYFYGLSPTLNFDQNEFNITLTNDLFETIN